MHLLLMQIKKVIFKLLTILIYFLWFFCLGNDELTETAEIKTVYVEINDKTNKEIKLKYDTLIKPNANSESLNKISIKKEVKTIKRKGQSLLKKKENTMSSHPGTFYITSGYAPRSL